MVKRLLIWAGLFGLMGASSVWAQDKAKETEERYYWGIGVGFFEFRPDVVEAGGHDNSQGQFNGLAMVSRILANSPASKAGVREGWFVAEIDGQDVWKKGEFVVVDLIRGNGQPGKSVKIKFCEYQKDQQSFRDIELTIPFEKLDAVAWLPLDRWLVGSLGTGAGKVEFVSRVSEVKPGVFLYSYRLANTYKTREVFVEWELLDMASSGTWNSPALIRLKPGETKEFTFTSEGLPAYEDGLAKVFYQANDELMKGLERTYNFRGQPDGFLIHIGSSMPGLIPQKLFNEVQINKLREQ